MLKYVYLFVKIKKIKLYTRVIISHFTLNSMAVFNNSYILFMTYKKAPLSIPK